MSGAPVPSLLSLVRSLASGPAERSPPRSRKRYNHTASLPVVRASSWTQRQYGRSKDELMKYVDQPNEPDSVGEHLEFLQDPFLRRYAPADGPELTVSGRERNDGHRSWREILDGAGPEGATLLRLRAAVLLRLKNPAKISTEHVYELYQQLPEPRMLHFPFEFRRQFMKSFAMVEKKNAPSMLRYFALVADVKNSGFPLSKPEWDTAISFAARYVGRSGHAEAEAALTLWREMENDADKKADGMTFNILFDVASKAGNFTLAEMLYKEMAARGYEFNRYHHVSLIHFFGLKGDADGVRVAYKEMVEAGEMVDTLALNAVIAGLLRCGEEDSAARVYDRMVASLDSTVQMPIRDFTNRRVVTQILMMFGKMTKEFPGMRASLQKATPMVPDLATYRILINHFGTKLGDIFAVAKYLYEMRFFEIPMHGAIFLALFKGFEAHGGYNGSPWSEKRLLGVWEALLRALDNKAAGLYIDEWMATAVLRAFQKCSSPEMIFKAYNAMSTRWDLTEERLDFMIDYLHMALKKAGQPVPFLGRLGGMTYYNTRGGSII